jgi:hypothetical protein
MELNKKNSAGDQTNRVLRRTAMTNRNICNIPAKNKSTNLPVLRPKAPPSTLRLGGMEPSEDMGPGEYLLACLSGVVERGRVVLHYEVIDGPHTGTGLRQWITVHENRTISPSSRYAQQVSVALGRPADTSDNLNDPGAIFSGRFFRAFVGFRKTDRPGEENPRRTSL